MPGSHQLPDVHGDVAELVAEETAEAHERGGIADDFLRVRHHFGPVRGRRAGEETQRPATAAGQSPAGQAGPGKHRHVAVRLSGGRLVAVVRLSSRAPCLRILAANVVARTRCRATFPLAE